MERQGPMTQARQAFEGLVMPADADELIERLNRAKAVGTGTDDGWAAFFPDGSAAFIDWEKSQLYVIDRETLMHFIRFGVYHKDTIQDITGVKTAEWEGANTATSNDVDAFLRLRIEPQQD